MIAAEGKSSAVLTTLQVEGAQVRAWIDAAQQAADDGAATALLERVRDCADAGVDELDLARALSDRLGEWSLSATLATRAAEAATPGADRLRRLAVLHNLAGHNDDALLWAERARALDPGDVENALLLGTIYNATARYPEALARLSPVIIADPGNLRALQQLAISAERLGRLDQAATFILRAQALDGRDPHIALHAAHVLMHVDRWPEARDILAGTLDGGGVNVAVLRTLSGIYAHVGEYAEAIEAIDKSIATEPRNIEFLIHKAALLLQIGLIDEADECVNRAIEIDPRSPWPLRFKIQVEMQRGDYDRAIKMSAMLITIAPDPEDGIANMQHALSLRGSGGQIDGAGILEAKRRAPPRPPRPKRTLADGFATQRRVLGALLLREVRTRFGESRLGYIWALLEIGIHIGVLAMIFPFTMHGKPPIGDSFFFFYFTGLVPYLLFSHVVSHVGHSIKQNQPLLELPQVTNIDVVLARGLLEFVTILIVAGIFLVGFIAFDTPSAVPASPANMMAALFVSWALGMGFGAITAVINVFTHVWDSIFQVLVRLLYFASGIFYVPAMMPEWARDILVWNPLLHTVDWFRTSFFTTYHPHWFEPAYPVVVAVILILVSMVTEFALRKQIKLAK